MRSWVPYSAGDPDGRNLTRAKDELFQLRHERRDTYVLPLRTLDGEVQKIGTRPAHAGTCHSCTDLSIAADQDPLGSMYDIWKGIWLGEYTVALKVFRGVNPRDKDKEVSGGTMTLRKACAIANTFPQRIERQVDLWRALKHKNILRLYGICKLDYMATPPLYFVSPWMKVRRTRICTNFLEARGLTEPSFAEQRRHHILQNQPERRPSSNRAFPSPLLTPRHHLTHPRTLCLDLRYCQRTGVHPRHGYLTRRPTGVQRSHFPERLGRALGFQLVESHGLGRDVHTE